MERRPKIIITDRDESIAASSPPAEKNGGDAPVANKPHAFIALGILAAVFGLGYAFSRMQTRETSLPLSAPDPVKVSEPREAASLRHSPSSAPESSQAMERPAVPPSQSDSSLRRKDEASDTTGSPSKSGEDSQSRDGSDPDGVSNSSGQDSTQSPALADPPTLQESKPLEAPGFFSIIVPAGWTAAESPGGYRIQKQSDVSVIITDSEHPDDNNLQFAYRTDSMKRRIKDRLAYTKLRIISSPNESIAGRQAVAMIYTEKSPTTGAMRYMEKFCFQRRSNGRQVAASLTIIRPYANFKEFSDEINSMLSTLTWAD